MKEVINIRRRYEGQIIPEGICITECLVRDRIYIRQGNTIGIITLPKEGWDFEACPYAMHYTVEYKEEEVTLY